MMRFKLTLKQLTLFIMLFLLGFAVVSLYELGFLSKLRQIYPSVRYYVAYTKWVDQFATKENVRSENFNLIEQTLAAAHVPEQLLQSRLAWYLVDFQRYDPNSFVLDISAQVKSKDMSLIVFEKGDLTFVVSPRKYFGTDVWEGTVNTPRSADIAMLSRYFGLTGESIVFKNTSACFALNNACIRLSPNFFVYSAVLNPDTKHYDINFALIKNFHVKNVGSFIPTSNLSQSYKIYTQNLHGPKFYTYSFLPTQKYNCGEGGCEGTEYVASLQNDVIKSLTVKNINLTYLLLPFAQREVGANLIKGYLLPFYDVELTGNAIIDKKPYGVDIKILIPAFSKQILTKLHSSK